MNKTLRLLFMGNPDSVHVRRWAGFFAHRGHDVHVAGLWGPSADDASAPFQVHRLGNSAGASIRLRLLARHLDAQVLHAHYLTHYGWLAYLSGIRPYAVTLWGSDILLDVASSRARRVWARLVLRSAACVTADAPEIIQAAIRLGAHRGNVHLIQFGVDTSRFAPGPRPAALVARLGLDGRRIIFAPRAIKPLYNTLTLVEALGRLPDDIVIVGTLANADRPYAEHVARAVADAGLSERFRLVPAIPHAEIDAFYRAADVVASVPTSDGTPVSVLEALSSGVPVVATDLPNVRPWLEDVAADLLVPVADAVATVEALRRALDRPADEQARMAAAGRAIALARADEDANMLQVEEIYRELARR